MLKKNELGTARPGAFPVSFFGEKRQAQGDFDDF
jgi:hypothetical protein